MRKNFKYILLLYLEYLNDKMLNTQIAATNK